MLYEFIYECYRLFYIITRKNKFWWCGHPDLWFKEEIIAEAKFEKRFGFLQ